MRRRPGRPLAPALFALAVLCLIAAGVVWRIAHQHASDVEVYFVRFDGTPRRGSLIAVRRLAPPGSVEARLAAALGALLSGPAASGQGGEPQVVTEIPPGTTLLGVRVHEGVAAVNLSNTYTTGGGSTSMLARVWQVVYTATQFPDAQAAQILVDGRRLEALGGEGVPIGAPLRRPAAPPVF